MPALYVGLICPAISNSKLVRRGKKPGFPYALASTIPKTISSHSWRLHGRNAKLINVALFSLCMPWQVDSLKLLVPTVGDCIKEMHYIKNSSMLQKTANHAFDFLGMQLYLHVHIIT